MKRTPFLILMFSLVVCSTTHAATYCVSPSGSGSGTGIDWDNTLSWSGLTFVRGNTYYLMDGSYGSKTLNTAESGTQTITIRKATATNYDECGNLTGDGWSSTYGDGQAVRAGQVTMSTDYWVIDGVSRTNWTSGHGIKIDLSGSACISKGILITNSSNSIIRYVEIEGVGDDGDCVGGANDLIYSTGGANNITLQYSYLHDSGRTLIDTARNTPAETGWLVEYNYFYKNESNGDEHSEMWSLHQLSNVVVRYNIWDLWEGTGCIIALDTLTTGPTGWDIYGNLFINGNCVSGNGIIATDTGSTFDNVRFFNNVVYNSSGNCGISPGSGTGWYNYNNIFYNNSCASGSLYGTHDYNWFYGNSFTTPTEANRQIGTGDPFTNAAGGDFTLTAATNDGYDTGALIPGNDLDMLGITRGGDEVWDRGAFEYESGDSTPPTLNTVTIGSNGLSWTFVYSEAVEAASTGELCSDYDVTMMNAGPISLSYSSGTGTDTVVCTGSSIVYDTDSVSIGLNYSSVTGTIDDTSDNPLATIEDKDVTNSSQEKNESVSASSGTSLSWSSGSSASVE